jgi:hypothetical protein
VLAPNAPLRSAVTPRWRVRRPRRPQPRHRLRWRLYPHPLHRAHQPSRHKQQKSRSIAGRRDTPGPCCLRASVRSSHCCARSVAPRSASSPSSTRRWPCARSSRAWASPPQRRLWRQPGARRYRRCRMPGRTDSTPRPSQHRTTNSISVSRGKDSLTRIRFRSSGSARASGYQADLLRPVG